MRALTGILGLLMLTLWALAMVPWRLIKGILK